VKESANEQQQYNICSHVSPIKQFQNGEEHIHAQSISTFLVYKHTMFNYFFLTFRETRNIKERPVAPKAR